MNKEEFHRFVSESKGNESNICQICAIRDGKTVYEDSWRGFRPEDPVNVNSVTKGVIAILTGIAVDKGAIGSIDEKVLAFFPDYQVITIMGCNICFLYTSCLCIDRHRPA